MEYVNYIRSVHIEKKPLMDGQRVFEEYVGQSDTVYPILDKFLHFKNEKVERRIVDVIELFGQEDCGCSQRTLVAYSPEVQKLMKFPFDDLKRAKQFAEFRVSQSEKDSNWWMAKYGELLDDVVSASFLKRFKYLFTGRLEG